MPVAQLPYTQELADLRRHALAAELEPWRTGATAAADAAAGTASALPAHATVRLHTPPRLSRKVTHAVRHAAAALYGQLGLRGGACVEGWAELPAGYGASLEPTEEQMGGPVPTLYDPDPIILERLQQLADARRAADPAPLEDYYDAGSSWWVRGGWGLGI